MKVFFDKDARIRFSVDDADSKDDAIERFFEALGAAENEYGMKIDIDNYEPTTTEKDYADDNST